MSAGIAAADMEACRAMIRSGSLSFHAASKVLPARVRDPALALYAFCRVADDEVDEVAVTDGASGARDKAQAVLRLRDRLEAIYAGHPRDAAADRAFAAVVAQFEMPRALPEALLEGLAWDSLGRRYESFSALKAYAARVASAVGAMMCVLMGAHDADVLARACDLGLAMQLTNIARDVGEDARAGRLFLPLDWLEAEGVAVDGFMADPQPLPGIRRCTQRLLDQADCLYWRAATGVRRLPLDCRAGILAAGHVYSAIGAEVARAGYDSVTARARTGRARKLALMGLAVAQAGMGAVLPVSARIHARPEPEVAFLVDAAARRKDAPSRSEALIAVLAQLESRDRGMA